MKAWESAGRQIRRASRITAVCLGLVVVMAAVYEHVAAWRDSRVLAQVGRSVDIGGRTLVSVAHHVRR